MALLHVMVFIFVELLSFGSLSDENEDFPPSYFSKEEGWNHVKRHKREGITEFSILDLG